MTKPELPSGGGSFVREADGSLTKQEDATKPAPSKSKSAKPASASTQKKKGA